MKSVLACLLLAVLTACTTYQVQPEDRTVQGVLQRWAQSHGKSVKWEVDDLQIVDAVALNNELRGVTTLSQAVAVFLNMVEQGRLHMALRDREARPRPVMACIYDNAVLVTYQRGPGLPCSVALPAQVSR